MKKLIATLTIAMTTSIMPAWAPIAHAEQPKQPIVLTMFLHDELTSEDIRSMQAGYLDWLTRDLEAITGRDVNIVPTSNIRGLTDFEYRIGNSERSIQQWSHRIIDHLRANQLPRDKLHKYVLITKNRIHGGTSGIAQIGNRAAIASLTGYRVIAHEVGHLFNAQHEDGKFHWNAAPLPCFTNMRSPEHPLIKNCYRFSERSANVIRAYLKDVP